MECNRDTSGSTGQLSSSGSTGGGMHHSHSTPAGVDGGNRTPPATPKKGGKMLAIRVQMLDDTVTIFQVQAKALGRVLFDQVCKQLHLLEADYFGLEYIDLGTKYWLDLQKPISRQLGLSLVDPLLYFCVKFYTPDPGQLEEEYTRYLFCLQVKRDLAQGLMLCNDNTAALMASYIVQAECGDYVPEDYPDHTYLSSYKFVPHQDHEMEKRIMENHKKHAGQSPAEADLNLLETARRCELYGVKMHPAKDHENVSLNLAVAHMGILVFQNYTKINTFSWAKIRKISFKRKRFLIKLHPEGYGYYKDTVEFFFEGRNECKNFWKKCVENHGFFRCSSVKNVSRHKTRVLSRGSSFRYSGKTQKQIVEFVRDNYVKRQTFQRSASFRHSSAHSSATNMHTSSVGNSISAHPLLPLADSNLSVEASKLSASLGSMGAAVVRPGSPMTRLASRPRGTATCWTSAPDTRPTTLLAQTTNSPSPPLTTQSASPVTSATTSPHHIPYEDQKQPYVNSSPVAVHAAVHRADTGITSTIRTHTIVVRTPSSHKIEGFMDQSLSQFTNNYPSQTQSQNDLLPSANQSHMQTSPEYTYKSVTSLPKRHIWQRSASCRELYDFSFDDSGQAKHRVKPKPNAEQIINLEERKLESPITRYDDHRLLYSTSRDASLEIHQDIMMPDQKVYSSSYPGTTSYSQESVEDPGNYDIRDSQDDLSHDSYELIERSDDDTSGDYKYRKRKIPLNTRSCSLDSGNYLPSDTDSEPEKCLKSKSSVDVHQDIFAMEDPRDLPREIIPRKSDGSFYKAFKTSSRTSSLESKSDNYDTKITKSSRENLKKTRDRSFGSRTSSQESKSDYEYKKILRKNKSAENIGRVLDYVDSRTSSLDSKSEYYDATSKILDEPRFAKYHHEYDRKIHFERNYGTQKPKHDNFVSEVNRNATDFSSFPSFKETSHVHSISLQNVETEQNIRANRMLANLEQNTVPRTQKSSHLRSHNSLESNQRKSHTTHIWPESIAGVPTEIRDWPSKPSTQRSTESESNIFSFDEDKIHSIQENDVDSGLCPDHAFSVIPNAEGLKKSEPSKKDGFRDIFVEIEPRRLEKGRDPLQLHQPIERTKSDPNSIARQRLNSSSRRLLLMHQKSIDLTPAESSDEDYLYRQIPSAPPIPTKHRGATHFELPAAEFGHFDILKREFEGHKQKFEVPKSQFELLGAKTQSDLINLPPKSDVDIPYVLHKRHIMNGTATREESLLHKETNEIQTPETKEPIKLVDELKMKQKIKPKSPVTAEPPSSFLFTQNIDLSKVDPVTLEVDKSAMPVQHLSSPKRDITRIDPVLLEALNSKLSQIESDSPTSSKTESIKPSQKAKLLLKTTEEVKIKIEQSTQKIEPPKKLSPDKLEVKTKSSKDKLKPETKPKRVIKPRMQPGKKGGKVNKTKVRITSFSSDDESLDSDDVFGSAEATPTKLEFSPPQMRKEMESILKFESERKYLQYTMSSTEVEGSPPQTRRKTEKQDVTLELTQTELRRISERSISIPSSEDDLNIKTTDMQPVFAEPEKQSTTLSETEKDDLDKSVEETSRDQITIEEVIKDSKDLDDEMEREKLLLQSEIENDLKDLKVPAKTKITEITSPSLRRKGQSPLLFAHARLNLSEGSAFTLLQKQQALESPIAGRRAKSLDAAVISVSRLPPLNAFSSKDDTVEESPEEKEIISKKIKDVKLETTSIIEEEKAVQDAVQLKKIEIKSKVEEKQIKQEKVKTDTKIKEKQKLVEKDQIVPDVTSKPKKQIKSNVQVKVTSKSTVIKGRPTTQRVVPSKPIATKTSQKAATQKTLTSQKPVGTQKSTNKQSQQKTITTTKTKEKIQVSTQKEQKPMITEKTETKVVSDEEKQHRSLPTQSSLPLPEIKRTKSQEIESKRSAPKEKAKSLDKLEFKRMGSKERTKSQEESDTDIAKRKEKQQMLYETAIKQTKTLKSPVKDVLPVFPQVEEMVRERHGKLEISINTIENKGISLEDAIIITKSPKKLDKKLTKSLELDLSDDIDNGKTVQRLGKSLDLDNRPKEYETQFEFDFKVESVETVKTEKGPEEASPDSDDQMIHELVEAQVHKEPNEEAADTDTDKTLQDSDLGQDNVISDLGQDNIILEGTSLDVWLSVDDKTKDQEKLENIKVLHKSNDFFEQPAITKPPDLGKLDTKSSSDSQSIEKMSLGNSLDIKYIDDSGDSSHKSDKDAQLIAEMQKASETVGRLLRRKLEKRKAIGIEKTEEIAEDIDKTIVRVTSEDESLTEVSDLRCEGQEQDSNLLAVHGDHKDTLLKLSIERSRSEDTGSWVTVECDEYVGTEESFDMDNVPLESPEKNASEEPKVPVEEEKAEEDGKVNNLLTTETKHHKIDLLKRSSDQSRSSDTTGSWTSGEKDNSPSNVKETGTGDESSVSCSIGHAIGLSQTIEMFASRDQLDKDSPELDLPCSPRSPRICMLGRAFTIDEESSGSQKQDAKSDESSIDETNDIPKDLASEDTNGEIKEPEVGSIKYKKSRYPFEEKWSDDSELSQRLQKKITKKLSSADKNSLSSLDESCSEKRKNEKSDSLSKPSLHSFEKLSTESRNSVDTESSSGSFGLAVRMAKSGDIPKELSSTWKPFPLDSSGSSSFEEGAQDVEGQEYFLSRENSGDFAALSDVHYKGTDDDATPTRDDTEIPEDLANFPANFGYPCLTADIGGISLTLGATDMLAGYGTSFLSRTLSRISERSTNSEKSSVEDDSTKASTQSDSLNDESLASSDRQASLSSDPPSNARVSESDKKTPTNGIPPSLKESSKQSDRQIFEPIHNISNLLQRQISDDRRTSAEMAELSMDDIEIITSERGLRLQRQGSDDTIIDEECFEPEDNQSAEKFRSSSQESEDWPLPEIPQQVDQKPLIAMHEVPSSDTSQQTTQVFQPPQKTIPKTFGLRGSMKSQDSEQWPSPPSSVLEPPIVGNVETYYMTPPEEACKVVVDSANVSTYDNDSNSDNENRTLDLEGEKTHTYENVPTEHGSESISESLSAGVSGVKIVLETKSGDSQDSNSEEDLNISNLNDDVFTDTVDTSKNELRPPTVLRRSTTSDDSSHSGSRKQLKPPTSHKGSHSSYSDEECTSSMGTTLEDGTVRYALKPTKCTHSSHSEDTSIALSLSEWSNSTNTVKFQNLSSNSGTTKSSTNTSGLKSDDNSLTDIAQSISEWSSSNSNTLKAQQSSLQFQKLSSATSTGDSTLTDLLPTISDWSSSDTSKTLVPQQFFATPPLPERQSITRLGSSLDEGDINLPPEQLNLKSPQNIPSEDLVLLSTTSRIESKPQQFTKSTERPVVIPVQVLSDTEKSTESSSVEQRTVHTQKYDKDKQRYSQKHQPSTKSTERPVKVPLKLSKCSPYYSSSLSSESTPMAGTSPVPPISKTATVPLTRSHRKPISKSLFQGKSPPSENDSTSSMESPKSKSDRDRRGYRRRRQAQGQKRHKQERDQHTTKDDYFYVEQDPDITEYNEYIRNRNMEELAATFHYQNVLGEDSPVFQYSETLEEGYYPDGDSQSGSDIFRMEREDESDDDNDKSSFTNSNLSNSVIAENNNFYATSTPNVKTVNGSLNDDSHYSSDSYTFQKADESSPVRNLAKEQFMNSINANTPAVNGTNTTTIIADIEGEVKKKPKYPCDKTYYIAKEILMTELTYKKDLDVINVWFRDEVGKEEPEECSILLTLIAPLAQAHGLLVKDLEQRLQGWEGRGGPKAAPGRIADVLLAHLPPLLPIYEEYLDGHMLVLERLDTAFKQNSRFEQLYRDFETQKVCYLPLTTFVLKPLHRLLHYQTLLQRLLKHYGPNHPDRADCLTASNTLQDLMQPVAETLEHSENLATLCELQRDIVGFENLVQPSRRFIRHGCLLKHSRKGYQQRMFFLFSDILLYTSRSQVTLQFKVHGHMPLRGVLIEEPEGELASYGLIIYGGNRALTVAANSQEEKDKWKDDLQNAIQQARDKTDTKITYLSLKSCSSSDEIVDQCGVEASTQTKPQTQRSNTTVHVCWHRNTSISMQDELIAVENQLSGYLLRKFKSSNGWQKLWVVFTSFCLFFYKGCMDEFPLASLPLLGYQVGPPAPEDAIGKEFVFKLQYKNHIYFFRAESEYTYNRWMEVIGSATQSKIKRKQYPINENSIECSPEK